MDAENFCCPSMRNRQILNKRVQPEVLTALFDEFS